jgi:hypothetical protein
VLNEIYVNPSADNNSGPQSIDVGSEWVELFNASCEPIDVSGWYIATKGVESSNITGGALRIANGSIVPGLGVLTIGASAMAFGVVECKNNPFVLANTEGWVGLYDASGNPVEAVYWGSNPGIISNSLKYGQPTCNNLPSAFDFNLQGKMTYIGTDPDIGEAVYRFPDGSPNWTRNASGGGGTKDLCNTFVCETVPTAKILSNKTNICSDESLILTAANPNPAVYSYSWSNGASGITTTLVGTQTEEIKLIVKTKSGFCEVRDSVLITVIPTKKIEKIFGDDTSCENDGKGYTVDLMRNGVNYVWNAQGGNITFGQNLDAVVVDWKISPAEICVTPKGVCIDTTKFCKPINIQSPQNVPAFIGDTIVCKNQIAKYSAPDLNGPIQYLWSTDNGNFISNSNTKNVNVKWNKSIDRLCLKVNSYCISDTPVCSKITVKDSADAVGLINDLLFCDGDTAVISIFRSGDYKNFKWTSTLSQLISQNIDTLKIKLLGDTSEVNYTVEDRCIDTLNYSTTLYASKQLDLKTLSTYNFNPCRDSINRYGIMTEPNIEYYWYNENFQLVSASKNQSFIDTIFKTSGLKTFYIAGKRIGNLKCDTISKKIEVNVKECLVCDQNINAKFMYKDSILCNNKNSIFPTLLGSAKSGKWTINPSGNIDASSGEIKLDFLQRGTYTIVNLVSDTNPLCSSRKDSFQIVVRKVDPIFTFKKDLCQDEEVTVRTNGGPFEFFWNGVKGDSSKVYRFKQSTSLPVRVKDSSCIVDLRLNFNVEQVVSRVDTTIELCNNGAINTSLDFTKQFSNGGLIPFVTSLNGAPLLSVNNFDAISKMAGNYQYKMKRFTGSSCIKDSSIVTINVKACNVCTNPPQAKFSLTSKNVCSSDSIIVPLLTGDIGGIWSVDKGLTIDSTGKVKLTKDFSGQIIITYFIPLSGSCPSSVFRDTVDVQYVGKPTRILNVFDQVCENDQSKNLFIFYPQGTQLLFFDSLRSPTLSPLVSDQKVGNYKYFVVSKLNNCVSDTLEIKYTIISCSNNCVGVDKIDSLILSENIICKGKTFEIKAQGNFKKGEFSIINLDASKFKIESKNDSIIRLKIDTVGQFRINFITELNKLTPQCSTDSAFAKINVTECITTDLVCKSLDSIYYLNFSKDSYCEGDTIKLSTRADFNIAQFQNPTENNLIVDLNKSGINDFSFIAQVNPLNNFVRFIIPDSDSLGPCKTKEVVKFYNVNSLPQKPNIEDSNICEKQLLTLPFNDSLKYFSADNKLLDNNFNFSETLGKTKYLAKTINRNCISLGDTFSITVNEAPKNYKIQDIIYICESSVFVLENIDSSKYTWTTSISPNTMNKYQINLSGKYSYFLTDKVTKCESQLDSFFIILKELPKLNIKLDTINICKFGSYVLQNFDSTRFDLVTSLGKVRDKIAFSNEGKYWAFLVDRFSKCESQIDTFNIMQYPESMIDLQSENISCYGLSDGSITIFNWKDFDSLSIDRKNISLGKVENLEKGEYIIASKDRNGCKSSLTVELNEPINPNIQIIELKDAYNLKDTVLLTFDPSNIIGRYRWISESKIICDTCRISFLLVEKEGKVKLEILDEFGCIYSDSTLVKVIDRPNILPNVFTKKVSGNNSTFDPFKYLHNVDRISIAIYDRWGNRLFRAINQERGTFEGIDFSKTFERYQSGVYVFTLDFVKDGVEERITSSITILD